MQYYQEIINMKRSELRQLIKEEIQKVLNEKCTRKVGNDWRVISGKTGKLWPQKYKSEEKAKSALRAYHFSRGK